MTEPRRAEIRTVFISATQEDLAEHRAAARDAAIDAGFFPTIQEYFPATGERPPLDAYLAKVDEADVVIAVVAHRYGWEPPGQPPDQRRSITWLECAHAAAAGKAILGFLVDDKTSWPENQREEFTILAALRERKSTPEMLADIQRKVDGLRQFKAWLGQDRVRATFTTPDDLRAKVVNALHSWRALSPVGFDVFICHNSQDKPQVREICNQLRAVGVRPWLDEDQLRPGLPWQVTLENQISMIGSAAVFVGASNVGPWQSMELRAFLDEFVRRGCPVIPVLLPGVTAPPALPILLRQMTWVDFRRESEAALNRLVWGITGRKPTQGTTLTAQEATPSAAPSSRLSDRRVCLLRVFVSSPADMKAERAMLDEVVQRINETTGVDKEVRLELFKWERNVVPRIGPPALEVVDEQTPAYDIYLGIMAHRFGTPSGSYGSGTEAEFRDALQRWSRIGAPWILFYFSRGSVDPDELDLDQYAKVRAFREELRAQGLYETYQGVRGSSEAFFEKVGQHLRLILQRMPPPGQEADRPVPGRPPQAVTPTVPAAYRAWLQGQCADLEFRGLRLKHGQAVRLNHVYVPLTTSAGAEEEAEERRAVRLAHEKPRLLLGLLGHGSLYVSGAPGSGKSMFCRWVAWLTCSGAVPPHEVEAPEGYEETLDASLRDRLPLLVRLRDFWPLLPTTPGLQDLSRAELEAALGAWVHAKLSADLAWADVRPHIERGSALLIIDGVDEVPLSHAEGHQVSHPRRLLLAGLGQAIPEWVRLGNRVLLTSRPYGLSGGEAGRLGITQAPVEDLADEAQTLLARRWFHVLTEDRAAAETTAREMIEHVREREWLEPLTGNPVLLTAMCILYGEGKRLPQDKCDLYARFVENVLHNRYAADPSEIELVRSRLSVIAHGMHTGAGLGETRATPHAEAAYDEIDRMIQAYRERSAWTEAGFKGVVQTREDLLSRSGLLLPRGDRRAGFYHLSFQDFLAAQRLLDLESERLADVFRERAAAPEWRLALSFVFGSLVARSSPEPGIRLLTRLVEVTGPGELGLHVVVGECIEMLIGRGIRLQPAVEERARNFCLAAIEREAPLPERHALGLTLGRLGDSRIVRDLRDRSAYVEVKAGAYVLGDERKPFTLEWPFLMSRYAVTNSQYEVFTKGGGYENPAWWSEEGHRWLAKSGVREPEYWRRGKWNNPNQPVVGVSFWEAEAFSAWAGGRLPTADEWECAARGPEGLDYPWGNKWKDGICNTHEARLGGTSAVGLFPRSRSKAFGLEDIAGNVWEWCGDIRGKGRLGDRVVRGGSWYLQARFARSADRNDYPPDFRGSYLGVRVVGAGGVRTS